jgi:hypothetical protein
MDLSRFTWGLVIKEAGRAGKLCVERCEALRIARCKWGLTGQGKEVGLSLKMQAKFEGMFLARSAPASL